MSPVGVFIEEHEELPIILKGDPQSLNQSNRSTREVSHGYGDNLPLYGNLFRLSVGEPPYGNCQHEAYQDAILSFE